MRSRFQPTEVRAAAFLSGFLCLRVFCANLEVVCVELLLRWLMSIRALVGTTLGTPCLMHGASKGSFLKPPKHPEFLNPNPARQGSSFELGHCLLCDLEFFAYESMCTYIRV